MDEKHEEQRPVELQGGPWCDPLLQMLVDSIDHFGRRSVSWGFSITLFVSGSILSGRLISAKEYLDNAGKPISDALKAKNLGELAEVYDSIYKGFTDIQADESEAKYIHMLVDYYYQGSKKFNVRVPMYWRARLSAVDAFLLGTWEDGQ